MSKACFRIVFFFLNHHNFSSFFGMILKILLKAFSPIKRLDFSFFFFGFLHTFSFFLRLMHLGFQLFFILNLLCFDPQNSKIFLPSISHKNHPITKVKIVIFIIFHSFSLLLYSFHAIFTIFSAFILRFLIFPRYF